MTLLDATLNPMKTPETDPNFRIRAVIYVRISQDRTGAGLGVDRQREDCMALAERNGWQVVETYVDNDVSAYSGKPRKDYRRMLADLAAGKATVVIAWHNDRLHRSPTELEEYIDISDRRGVNTHTVQGGTIDLSTSNGRMVARMLGAVARHESEHKAERVARARLQSATAGKWGGGIRPFGWGVPTGETTKRINKKTGEEHEVPVLDMNKTVPAEAQAALEMAEALLAGASLRSRTRLLNDKGMLTTQGNRWTTQATRDMLLRPRNAGIAVYKGKEIGKGPWDPIIPEPTWRAVVALLKDPARQTAPDDSSVRWLGSLLYQCGAPECPCDGRMICSASGGKLLPTYRCRLGHANRRADILDQYVEDVIIERLSRPDAHALLLPRSDVDVPALQAEQVTLRNRLADLSAMFAAGTIDGAQLATGSQLARGQLEGIQQQLATAATHDPLAAVVGAPDPRAAWKDLELDRKRALLRALVTVTVRPARPGRMPDGSYTDLENIDFEWKRKPQLKAVEG